MLKAVFQELHIEGLIKEFYLSRYCKSNLALASHIVLKTMKFENWEVATPLSERVIGEESADLFKLNNESLKKYLFDSTKIFYRDLLQLDSTTGQSVNSLSQDLEHVSESKSTFQW